MSLSRWVCTTILVAVVGSVADFWSVPLHAEPWLANRFAQNCSGCHAPGRKNLPPRKRRCTLSCQGCHVNPNGGGMRSHYGKWTENVWLRSYRLQDAHPPRPAPYHKQPYAKRPWVQGKKSKSKKFKKAQKRGLDMKVSKHEQVDEAEYDNRHQMHAITADSKREFRYQIPQDDPYRLLRLSKLDVGADVRWQYNKLKLDSSNATKGTSFSTDVKHNFLMSGDLGVRWRPLHTRYHVVYEGRALGNPTQAQKPENTFSTMNRRSLYVMADDLPYNTYLMAGIYRPIFGTNQPDHTALPQRMISWALQGNFQSYNLNYKALTMGGSPNVPFANVHLIDQQVGAVANDTNRGYGLNIGGRFVTLGASVTYSYWSTEKKVEVASEKVKQRHAFHALGLGAKWQRTVARLDAVSLELQTPYEGRLLSNIYSLDTYTRLWRELYLNLAYHLANTAETLLPGSANQLRAGIRWFILPGVDFMLAYHRDSKKTTSADSKTEDSSQTVAGFVSQLHFYL